MLYSSAEQESIFVDDHGRLRSDVSGSRWNEYQKTWNNCQSRGTSWKQWTAQHCSPAPRI